MRSQVMAHTGVRTNDMYMLIYGLKMFPAMYFAMNKVNYERLALQFFLSSFDIYYALVTKCRATQRQTNFSIVSNSKKK